MNGRTEICEGMLSQACGSDAHYRQLIEEQLVSQNGQKTYCLQVLEAGGLQPWQSKEYSDLVEGYTTEITDLERRLAALP